MLLIGHVLTESYIVFWRIWPWLAKTNADNLFIDKSAKPGVTILWFIKIMCDGLLWCTVFYVMAQMAKNYSRKLFLMACLFFAYHCFDLFMHVYNFASARWLYIVMLAIDAVALGLVIWPINERVFKYKSLD